MGEGDKFQGKPMSTVTKTICGLLLASTAFTSAFAQEAPADEQPVGEEIIVTGSRATGGAVADSAAPVTLLTGDSLARVA